VADGAECRDSFWMMKDNLTKLVFWEMIANEWS